MWTLLKMELRYSTPAWLFAYAICLVILVVTRAFWDQRALAFMMNTSIAYGITMGIVGSEADAQHRPRAVALLPLPPRAVALVDLIYVTFFQLGMVVIWIGLVALSPQLVASGTLWAMVSHSALTISLITVFIVHTHLSFYKAGRYTPLSYLLLLAVLVAVGALAYTGHIQAVGRFLFHHYMSASGALASTVLWLGLSWLSVFLYVRRESYLG